mmetsp:Transcript_34100/g.96027  ORF Transcript_34100/g.96027 Transcript_34100/m.96027 type:complete len:678 (-) Transcript_34100:1120-3153(-)
MSPPVEVTARAQRSASSPRADERRSASCSSSGYRGSAEAANVEVFEKCSSSARMSNSALNALSYSHRRAYSTSQSLRRRARRHIVAGCPARCARRSRSFPLVTGTCPSSAPSDAEARLAATRRSVSSSHWRSWDERNSSSRIRSDGAFTRPVDASGANGLVARHTRSPSRDASSTTARATSPSAASAASDLDARECRRIPRRAPLFSSRGGAAGNFWPASNLNNSAAVPTGKRFRRSPTSATGRKEAMSLWRKAFSTGLPTSAVCHGGRYDSDTRLTASSAEPEATAAPARTSSECPPRTFRNAYTAAESSEGKLSGTSTTSVASSPRQYSARSSRAYRDIISFLTLASSAWRPRSFSFFLASAWAFRFFSASAAVFFSWSNLRLFFTNAIFRRFPSPRASFSAFSASFSCCVASLISFVSSASVNSPSLRCSAALSGASSSPLSLTAAPFSGSGSPAGASPCFAPSSDFSGAFFLSASPPLGGGGSAASFFSATGTGPLAASSAGSSNRSENRPGRLELRLRPRPSSSFPSPLEGPSLETATFALSSWILRSFSSLARRTLRSLSFFSRSFLRFSSSLRSFSRSALSRSACSAATRSCSSFSASSFSFFSAAARAFSPASANCFASSSSSALRSSSTLLLWAPYSSLAFSLYFFCSAHSARRRSSSLASTLPTRSA